jgi:FkbM family methyltransferase
MHQYGKVRIAQARVPGIDQAFTLALHDDHDQNVSEQILATGIWEPLETELIRRALTDTANASFVDCGANIGWYSVVAAMLGANVIAFEPMPSNAALLRENINRNGLAERVVVHEVALGSGTSEAILELSDTNQGDHRLVTPDRATTEQKSIRVPVVTLSNALRDTNRKPTVIKLDTQGSEVGILRGGRALWDRVDPPTLVIEFWPFGLQHCGSNTEDFLELLRALISRGCRCLEIVEWRNCLVERSIDELHDMTLAGPLSIASEGFTNLFLVPLEGFNRYEDLVEADVDWDAVRRMKP